MIYDLPDEKVTVSFPSQEKEDSTQGTLANDCTTPCHADRHGTCGALDSTGNFHHNFNFMFLMTISYFNSAILQREEAKKSE